MVGSAFIHALTHHESCICSSLFVPLVSVTYRLEHCHTQFSANPDISFIVSFSTEHTLLCLHDRQLVIVNNWSSCCVVTLGRGSMFTLTPSQNKKKKSLSSKSDLGTRTKCKSSLVVVSTCSDYPMAGSTKLQRNIWVSAVEKQLKTITEYDWNIISLVPGVPPFQSFLFFSFQATSECKTNLTHPERLEDVFVSSFHKVFQWSLRSHVRPLLQWRKQFLSVDPQQH